MRTGAVRGGVGRAESPVGPPSYLRPGNLRPGCGVVWGNSRAGRHCSLDRMWYKGRRAHYVRYVRMTACLAETCLAERGRLVSDAPATADPTWVPPTWEEIVRDHSTRVYRLAYRLSGNRHDAE